MAGAQEELPRLLGGRSALDFVNTVDPRHAAMRTEFLTSYRALIDWGVHARLLDGDEADALRAIAARHPRRAEKSLVAAIEFREQLYASTAALLQHQPPEAAILAGISGVVTAALSQRRLATAGPARLRWQADLDLDMLLQRVAIDAADLLTSSDLDRVRECPGEDGCGWLFLDTSKSRNRRWCSMQLCGNRAKIRRHRATTTV